MSGSTIIGGLFVVAGLATIAATAGREWLTRHFSAADGESAGVSNAAAPAAFCEHVWTVIAASEGAPAEVRSAAVCGTTDDCPASRNRLRPGVIGHRLTYEC